MPTKVPKNPKKKYPPIGRPGEWNDRFIDMAYNHCLLGATDESLSRLLGINIDTLHEWKKNKPGFSEAIRAAKEGADEEIVKALYHKAKGFKHIVQRPIVGKHGIEIVEYEERLAPDATSALFWLKNRHGKYWREKQEIDQNVQGNISFTFEEVSKKEEN